MCRRWKCWLLLALGLCVLLIVWGSRTHREQTLSSLARLQPFFTKKHPFRCERIFAGDDREISLATDDSRTIMTDYEFYRLLDSCSALFTRHFYPLRAASETEDRFPIAYAILVNEHLEQVEMLLNAIYAPQNVYCIHVDLKAAYIIHAAVRRLSTCLPNVVVSSRSFPVSRLSIEMVDAVLSCIDDLYAFEKAAGRAPWKYLLTLQGHDFPLKTNAEIVTILRLHRGANDVELMPAPANVRYLWKYVFDDAGIPKDVVRTKAVRGPPPNNIVLYKGNFAVSLSRRFVDDVHRHDIPATLLTYLRHSASGDEIFWSSLNHNDWLNFSGSYPGRCVDHGFKTWISRFTLWWTQNPAFTCRGRWRNSVCLLTVGDLHNVIRRPHLFVNKFWLPDDPVALDCMHELLFKRNYMADTTAPLNLSFYENLPAVRYQQHRLKKVSADGFPCN